MIEITTVQQLLKKQFPKWSDLSLERVSAMGTDHVIYRLGTDMCVRLPLLQRSASQVEKEQRWLPRLAPFLPLAIPVVLGGGVPGDNYPWKWSVYGWIEGESVGQERMMHLSQIATPLALFIKDLSQIDPVGGPLSGAQNEHRGVPLAKRDADVRAAIENLKGVIDTDCAAAVWTQTLKAPVYQGPGVWVHGDLHVGNVLIHQGRLSGIIDFGLLGVGDPACDLMAAWTLLPSKERSTFRSVLAVDDATWERARGWALSFGLIALAYYKDRDAPLVAIGRHVIEAALSE